ncbi:MAG: hypothetical protein JRL30_05015 [Deltaproteobacteria bacterium]|nr:hypothetical protein [Deltaproteobacteria bacterium]
MIDQDPATPPLKDELDDDDRFRIAEVFHEDIVPRLMMMHARNGTINCEFAGEQYKNWVIEFKSSRSGLDIVDFEYDRDSRSFALPGQPLKQDMAQDV